MISPSLRARRQRAPTIGFDIAPGAGGPSRYVAALLRGLDPAEWEVVFPVSPQPSPDEASQCGSAAPGSSAIGQPRPLGRRLFRMLPSAVRYVTGFVRQSFDLSRQISPAKLDIFHVQNTGCEEAPLGGRLAGAGRILGTFHVNPAVDLQRQREGLVHRSLEAISNRCLHQAIAVSHATKRDWLRRTGLRDEHVTVIHNGIDPQRFCRQRSRESARASLQLPADALIVGGLGRLEPAKGFADLIKAAALWRTEFPRSFVAIAGEGSLRRELSELALSLGIADRVILLGHCGDVNLFLDACDIFAMPSLSEALPFALLEAMAHELPAVGTNVGGVPEVILPNQTGFLVPPHSPAALAAALRPLLACVDLRRRLGGNARQRVSDCFHEAEMVRRTLNLYRELLPARRH